jgi:hypothetical protein
MLQDVRILSYYFNYNIGDYFVSYPKGLDYFGEIVFESSSEEILCSDDFKEIVNLVRIEFL